MPYTIKYESDGGVITTFSGLVSEEEWLTSGKERTTPIEKVDSYRYLLSDFTNVSKLDISIEGVRLVVQLTKKIIRRNPDIRMAIVVPTDFEFGIGRMWHTLTKRKEEKAALFRTMEEAVDWLNV